MPVIDGGPAGCPCTCGTVGRYPYGATRTARCTNRACPVIVYHARPAPGTTPGRPPVPRPRPWRRSAPPPADPTRSPPRPTRAGRGATPATPGAATPGATTDQKPPPSRREEPVMGFFSSASNTPDSGSQSGGSASGSQCPTSGWRVTRAAGNGGTCPQGHQTETTSGPGGSRVIGTHNRP